MNRSNSRIKQQKKSTNSQSRNNSRQILEKSKTQTRNIKIDKQDKLIVNAKKGVNVGKRTGQQIKKKETGLNYDGTERLSDYFAQQDGLSIDSDQNEIVSDNFEQQKGDLKVSSISDLQDDSQIIQLFNNKRDSLEFNLSPEQSLYDRKSIDGNQQSKKLRNQQNQIQAENNNLFETSKKNVNKSDRRKESSLGLKSFTSNLLEIPSTNNRKTSSFRLQRSQNSKYRNSIALSSIPKISRFSGRINDNGSDVSSDRLDDFELLGQLSNLPPELVAKSIQQGTSLDDTPFTKNIEDFEITLSESEISQQNQQSNSIFRDDRRKSENQNNRQKNFNEQNIGLDDEEEEEEEIQQLLKQNKQIISQISQRKKMNNSNSFNSYLLDISESKIYNKSDKKSNNVYDFGKISPIQEINTQQSNKNEDSFRKNKNEMANKSLDNFMEIVNPNKQNLNEKKQMQSEQYNEVRGQQNENEDFILSKNVPNKNNQKQENQQNLKMLKPNQMLDEKEEINQNFQYKKNQRNNKKKQLQETQDMSVEDQVDIQIQAKNKQQKIKQLKKNRVSLDSSDISLQIKEQSDSANQSKNLETNEELQKKLLIDQYIKQKRGSTDFQFSNQQENNQKRISGFNNQQKITLNQQENQLNQNENNDLKQLEKNEITQNVQNTKLKNANLEQNKNNQEKNNSNQNEINVNQREKNSNQKEKNSDLLDNCIVQQVNNENINVENKLSLPPTMKVDSDQKQNYEYDLNSHSYNVDNDLNMEVMQNQSYFEQQGSHLQIVEQEISFEKNKQSSQNKKMDVENEGVIDQFNLPEENLIRRKAGRPKRKRITPQKLRNNSQSAQESDVETEVSNDSIQGKQNNKKQKKKSQNNSQVSSVSSQTSTSKQLKKIIRKQSQKNNSKQILQQYEDFYAKGFQNKIEVEVKAETSSFGKDGRYPVRNRIRPLVSWRERAVYGKEGLLYIITDQSLEKLDYVNYTVPGFSDVREPRLHKKNNKKAINKNTSQSYKSLDQIKEEEADDTEMLKNTESQKYEKNEKESAGTKKLSNRNSNFSSDKRIKSKSQQRKSLERGRSEDDDDDDDEIPSQKKNQKNKNTKNHQNNIPEKSKSQSPLSKAQLKSPLDQKNQNFKDKKNQPRQRSSESSVDNNDSKLQKQDQKNKQQTQRKEKHVEEKFNKRDQVDLDFIQNLFSLEKISQYNIKIFESSTNILKFSLALNPGLEIQCQKTKYAIEVKVIECSWKKLLICIEDSTNYLKQDDKKLIKKDQYFSLKYKEKENSKNCQLLITIFKNQLNSKSSKS
ncbi:hypothetical protein TTHERM_01212850 (macronuclear) [Tetrahymena thermophila SB210]|uniref:Uncharacterized protein n=1 Tax=Tetrahymena thermophila (strain SB210) TaxID=312017 RepID=Q24G81_TETTS|nr:hypothetical protein TTHERM_01212850 [Tetrahymena thermophila SB210]EAS06772.2 hypothetical protein TTHERM_01212850 [Tetrahymena thermophila SB210]|eukprot:XP_001027014.2 hypothetical protein TTHERM_01212850 [Tetrahymena thermophila SB210]